MNPDLKTRREWADAGFAVPLNTKPAQTEDRDGRLVALFSADQSKPKLQPGEAANWSFVLLRQPSNLEWIQQQFELADHYATVLRKIELERRHNCDDLLRKMFPEYRDTMRDIDDAERLLRDRIDAVRAENQRARRRVDTDEQKGAIADARNARNSLYEMRSKVVKKCYADAAYKEAAMSIDSLAEKQNVTARKKARDAGLGWGTAGQVEEGARDLRKGPPPNLRRENADSLYTQMQAQKEKPPLTWERILSGVDLRIKATLNRKLAVVSVRLGGEGREGQWVDCDFALHRKRPNGEHGLPIGATVKGVRLCRRMVGYRAEWSIVFTLERRGGFDAKPRAEAGVVAIDVGYRKLPHGVRVAYWAGDDGRHGEVVLPEGDGTGLPPRQHEQDILEDFAGNRRGNAVGYYLQARKLQAIRDENFDAMTEALGAWCKSVAELPEWLTEEAKVLHAVRSKERMLGMCDHWAANRFSGDEAGYEILSRWRHWKDDAGHTHGELHLAAWEAESRAKFARWRKEYFRRFWGVMRRQYATVVFEDLRLSSLRSGKVDPDEKETRGDGYANMASLYLFREIGGYRPAKQRTDPGTVYVDPADTTTKCHLCGHPCEWDQARHLKHQCERCGHCWDQDENAAKNISQAYIRERDK